MEHENQSSWNSVSANKDVETRVPLDHNKDSDPTTITQVENNPSNDSNDDQQQQRQKEGITTPDKQLELFTRLCTEQQPKPGDTCYIIPKEWLLKWKAYCESYHINQYEEEQNNGNEKKAPGPVNNNVIAKQDGSLLPNLSDNKDVSTVPEGAWELFKTSYGINGPIITRKYLSSGFELLYPIKIKIYVVNDQPDIPLTYDITTISISNNATHNELKREIQQALNITTKTSYFRLWKLIKNPNNNENEPTILDGSEEILDSDDVDQLIDELALDEFGCAVELSSSSNIKNNNSEKDEYDYNVQGDELTESEQIIVDNQNHVPRERQLDLISKLYSYYGNRREAGDVWYILPIEWKTEWEAYCTSMSEKDTLGPVDIHAILDNEDNSLIPDLEMGKDFQFVPEKAWKLFDAWYGVNGDPLPRIILPDGDPESIYPNEVRVYVVKSKNAEFQLSGVITFELTESATLEMLRERIEQKLAIPADMKYHLWRLETDIEDEENPFIEPVMLQGATQLSTHDKSTIVDLELDDAPCALELIMDSDDDDIYQEEIETVDLKPLTSASSSPGPMMMSPPRGMDGPFDEPPPSYTSLDRTIDFGPARRESKSEGDYADEEDEIEQEPEYEPGLCGLVNMGNTCYMNSALQCLSNTAQLTQYFIEEKYKNELNRDNPLGMHGELAEAYGGLIKDIWSGRNASIAPRQFKYTISRFNSTFIGYRQHDSQELLSFLLDGLHEDLNRIVKKPYVELPDFDDMADGDIAMRCWEYHKARNDSIIVDLFQGQFKSRLICQECQKISIMFDPFMYLSLPLPVQKKTHIKVVYVPYDPSERQRRLKLTFQSNSSIEQLQEQVAQRANIDDPTTLLVAEIYQQSIYKVYLPYEPISSIAPGDIIYVYQLPISVPNGQPVRKKRAKREDGSSSSDDGSDEGDWIVFPVYCATSSGNNNNTSSSTYSSHRFSSSSYTQFGGPIVLAMRSDEASSISNIYRLIAKHIERFTMLKLFEEVKEAPRQDSNTDEDDEDEAMELDSIPAQKSIHTSAAVTAAGGRRMEPLNNLFSMKLFWESGYHFAGSSEILPMIDPLKGTLVDLLDRQSTNINTTTQQQMGPMMGPSWDKQQVDESDALPFSSSYDEIEDEVDNPRNSVTTIVTNATSSLEEHGDKVGGLKRGEEEEDNDPMVTDTSTPCDNKEEEDLDKGQSPSLSMTTTDGRNSPNSAILPSSSGGLPSPVSWTTASSPKPLVKQGEGIVIVWPARKAQEMFGGMGSIDERAWDDMDMDDQHDAMDDDEDETKDKEITLEQCLDEFTREEMLGDQDLWYCPRCKKHQRAQKKIDLWCLPEIMVIHLKRFSSTRALRDKIDILIDFPVQELDMTERVTSSAEDRARQMGDSPDEKQIIYDLYAVDNHFGGMGGGHYTAFAQNPVIKEWCQFNDSHVSSVNDPNTVRTNAAYLLFYKRRRSEPNSSDNDVVSSTSSVDSTSNQQE